MSVAATAFSINPNFIHVYSFAFAIAFAVVAIFLNRYKKSSNPLNGTTIFLDLLRGASIFPLLLFSITPLMPEMGKLALTGEPVLIGLGACNGLFAIITDWWRSI